MIPKNLRIAANAFLLLAILFAEANGVYAQTADAQRLANSFGSENILLLVNENSSDSITLANHYIAARNIPGNQVAYLSIGEVKDGETMGSVRFQKEILSPVEKVIKDRSLEEEIDCIVFSAGFPTRVNVANQQKKYLATTGAKYSIHFHAPIVSLSSAMFFGNELFADSPRFLDTHANYFARRTQLEQTRSFRAGVGWKPDESVDESGKSGNRHRLSTVLAVIRPKGSTLQQAIDQIIRSSTCDGTLALDQKNDQATNGIFYLADHKDPRSRTRQNQYKSAADAIRSLGYKATIGKETVPQSQVVLGAVLGSAKHNWPKSKSEFAAGAYCDNFTSYGAWWAKNQTLATHFLNNGAAGATGMVYEPYTIPYKIPTAFAQYHYARGCTLGEAIYQSVLNPFQMLFLGDPLCRPFADLPEFSVEGLENRQVLETGEELSVGVATKAASPKIRLAELYVDGQLIGNLTPGRAFKLPATTLTEGYHQLRFVAVADHVSNARSSKIFDVFVRSENVPTLKLNVAAGPHRLGDSISVLCPSAKSPTDVVCNGRVVGKLANGRATLNLDSTRLGSGPVTLQAIGNINGRMVGGAPKTIQIQNTK